MARTNDTTKATQGSVDGSPDSPSSSATSSDDNALADRVELFMSDKITNISATLALQANGNASAEVLELAAEERMQAELLAFDNAFDQSIAGNTREEKAPVSSSTMLTAESPYVTGIFVQDDTPRRFATST